MSITLKALYERSKGKYKLNLLAGEAGLSNIVSWVQFTEDIMTIDFLKGSEFIFTTGLNCHGEDWISKFILQLIDKKAAGLVINIGKYIHLEDITEEILKLCNDHQFPLMSMPWEIHLSDIMQDYCNQLLNYTKHQDTVTSTLKNVLFYPETSAKYYEELDSYGFGQNEEYCVILIDVRSQTSDFDSTYTKNHVIQLTNVLNQEGIGYHGFFHENIFVVVVHGFTQEQLEKTITNLGKNPLVRAMGISEISDGIQTTGVSYREALAALKEAQKRNMTKCNFQSMGIGRLLFFVSDKHIMEKLYWENLGVLIEYDQLHGSCLTLTLEYYVVFDGSIQKVANEMFTHRNTVNYRVKKIKELLNSEIDTMETKFNLQLAFYIKNYLNL